jgi:hypothetical protein
MSWVVIAAAAVSAVSGAVAGSKGVPKVAAFTPVDPQDEQYKAIEGNIAELDQLAKLSSGSNAIATKDLLTSMETLTPGTTALRDKTTSTISSYLGGELPQDVIDQTRRLSAEAGVLGGFGPDSGMGRALTSRDLGLNTLNLVDRGLNLAQSWIQQTYQMAPKFDFTSMFVTPREQIETQVENNRGLQNQRQQELNMKAQKSAAPWAALSQGAGMVAGAFSGGGAGGGIAGMFGGGGGSSAAPASAYSYNSPTFQLSTPQLSAAASGQTFASGFYGRG